ncbi:MAG: hypothetical protein H6595_07015 [Flavobacteriales bacterium]|nr:hypothetical protein [Flavobacteriales bacterium]MCB9167216.1 hypothetical protein [Flavobacteriales bacterium]
MRWVSSIRAIFLLLVMVAFVACTKEEVMAPTPLVTERSMSDEGTNSSAMAPLEHKGGGVTPSLRSGGGNDDGGTGGISDDGDDEADSERNRKTPN